MPQSRCAHCRLKFDESVMISNESGLKFCCVGCKGVYEILNENGLSEFYERLGKNTLTPASNGANIKNLAANFSELVTKEGDFSQISFLIDGITCSACIWLLEKALFSLPGVLEVNINSLNQKAVIVFDEQELLIEQIIEKIYAVGYVPKPYATSQKEDELAKKRRNFYTKALVGIFATMNIMWLAIAQYSGYFSGIRGDIKDILSFAQFVLATPVLFYTGSEFFKVAKIAIKNASPNMDLLVITGASITYIYSIFAMFTRSGESYFDSVAMIITFVFIGKFLEILGKKKALEISNFLNDMLLAKVCVLEDGKDILKEPRDVNLGEKIVLRSGERALLDGVVLSGEASMDSSSLTGESLPVLLGAGGEVKSGVVCLNGQIVYEARQIFKNSYLNQLINLLQNAELKKPNIELAVNKIASKFSLSVLTLAFFTFWFWYFKFGFSEAIVTAVSVIVIACPCALALATPVSSVCALGVAFKNRVLFKEAKFFESLAKCDVAVFDKTGTLTKAEFEVSDFFIKESISLDEIYSLALISNHQISVAVAKLLKQKGARKIELKNTNLSVAKGVEAEISGKKFYAGSKRFLVENGIIFDEAEENVSFFVGLNGELVAKFYLKDSVKPEAKALIDELKSADMKVCILSGDVQKVVKNVADELGVSEFRAEMLPETKAKFISKLKEHGKKVLMVGDGINDAAALSLAHIAICMGSGAAISLERSDVVLLDDSLKSLAKAIKISKFTYKTIKQNLLFCLLYNVLALPFAVCGYVIPLFAALFMSLSSLSVILNSLYIVRKFKEK
ncbi:heavy metal translocating P-type ATPase [Campylobacter concisus]|uniref:heavy metal translocating P-type ATPase n=1 Tax=Campylobacter concisus TaxID=199 RepID=UPI003D19A5A4